MLLLLGRAAKFALLDGERVASAGETSLNESIDDTPLLLRGALLV